jgi:hypothetical protein
MLHEWAGKERASQEIPGEESIKFSFLPLKMSVKMFMCELHKCEFLMRQQVAERKDREIAL